MPFVLYTVLLSALTTISVAETVDIIDYPYLLAIEHDGILTCAASIISNAWTLTSALCSSRLAPLNLTMIRAGSNFRYKGGQLFQVAKMINHPKYVPTLGNYNVALLRISGTFPLDTPGLARVALSSVTPPDQNPAVVGWWGASRGFFTDRFSKTFQVTQVKIDDWDTCNADYRPFGGISKTSICASDSEKSCVGDEGSPLIDLATLEQVGVATRHYDCRSINGPGNFANVAPVRSWIALEIDV